MGFRPETLEWIKKAARMNDGAFRKQDAIHMGIGLIIVIALLQLINGQLEVDSNINSGTVITISLSE
jgi:sensor histidine kinase regulating citrate/malate metabolism